MSRTRTHGTDATYRNGCRCEPCRKAATIMQTTRTASRKARLAADPSVAIHGRNSTYSNWACRCDPCTKAHTERRMAYNRRRPHKPTEILDGAP